MGTGTAGSIKSGAGRRTQEQRGLIRNFILVVEDDWLLRLSLEGALQDAGYATLSCGGPDEALNIISGSLPSIMALVTDVDLKSRLNGWDIARQAAMARPSLPVVYVSSVSYDEWSANGVPSSLFVQKPYVEAALLRAVRSAIEMAVSTDTVIKGDQRARPSVEG